MHPPQDRTMVFACIGEVAQYMGAPIANYVDVWILLASLILFSFHVYVCFADNDTV